MNCSVSVDMLEIAEPAILIEFENVPMQRIGKKISLIYNIIGSVTSLLLLVRLSVGRLVCLFLKRREVSLP